MKTGAVFTILSIGTAVRGMISAEFSLESGRGPGSGPAEVSTVSNRAAASIERIGAAGRGAAAWPRPSAAWRGESSPPHMRARSVPASVEPAGTRGPRRAVAWAKRQPDPA